MLYMKSCVFYEEPGGRGTRIHNFAGGYVLQSAGHYCNIKPWEYHILLREGIQQL